MSTLNPKPLEPNAPISWDHYPAKGDPITRTGTVWCAAPNTAKGTTRVLWVIPDTHFTDDLYFAVPVGRARTDTPAHGQDHARLAQDVSYLRGEVRRLTTEGTADQAHTAQQALDATAKRASVADLHTVSKGALFSSGYADSPLGLVATAAADAARNVRQSRAGRAAA